MLELIASLIFGATVVSIIVYQIFGKAKEASFHQLSEARRWYNRGYITKKQIESVITDDGSLTLKGYLKLKSIVDRRRMIKALVNEESTKSKVYPKTQTVCDKGGVDDEDSLMETTDSRLVKIDPVGVESV